MERILWASADMETPSCSAIRFIFASSLFVINVTTRLLLAVSGSKLGRPRRRSFAVSFPRLITNPLPEIDRQGGPGRLFFYQQIVIGSSVPATQIVRDLARIIQENQIQFSKFLI